MAGARRAGTAPLPARRVRGGGRNPRREHGRGGARGAGGRSGQPQRAQALATALGVRAALDAEFGRLLEEWRQQARPDSGGGVHNHISGGTQHGPVLQGRDFSSITFDMRPGAPSATADARPPARDDPAT